MTDAALQDVQIVSLAANVPGLVAVNRLRQMGAAVIKIEPPGGDPLKYACPSWYESLCAGQQVVALNLKQTQPRDRLFELLTTTDLLVTASRPSALERLGVGWSVLRAKFPNLCQVAIVGYPSPHTERAGHDLTYQAEAGLVRPPDMPRTLLSDLAGAERAVSAALALLLMRANGRGANIIEVALVDSVDVFADPLRHGLTTRGSVLAGGLPQYNLYPAREGWVAVGALESHFLERLAEGLGLNRSELGYAELKQAFARRSACEWESWAKERDIPLVEVKDARNLHGN